MLELYTNVFPLAFFSLPGGAEWIIIVAFGLLIFGKRLPEVGRSLGKGIVEFKKGLKGVEDDIEEQSNKPAIATQPKTSLPSDAKFDPYTGKPIEQADATGQANTETKPS